MHLNHEREFFVYVVSFVHYVHYVRVDDDGDGGGGGDDDDAFESIQFIIAFINIHKIERFVNLLAVPSTITVKFIISISLHFE